MNDDSKKQTPDKSSDRSPSPAAASTIGTETGGETRIMKILAGLATALGFGKSSGGTQGAQTGDVNTLLAHQRTDLAMERSYLAADRTLMAWIRTSLSMISFGFTIGKLGQILRDVEVKGIIIRTRTIDVESIAHFLVILGTLALLFASLQHRHRMKELYAMGLQRQLSITLIVAHMLTVVGGFALSALVMAL
jgi:putative membrane protein